MEGDIMKKLYGVIIIIVIIFIIMINLVSISFFDSSLCEGKNISGWNEFELDMQTQYPQIDKIYLYSILPIETDIEYSLDVELDINQIETIVRSTIDYLGQDDVYADFQEKHIKEYGNEFDALNISFVLKKEDYFLKWEYFGWVDASGVRDYEDFEYRYIDSSE
jgi:hypothetical protein